jgi:hypothetical protein
VLVVNLAFQARYPSTEVHGGPLQIAGASASRRFWPV